MCHFPCYCGVFIIGIGCLGRYRTHTWRNISENGKRNLNSSVNGSILIDIGGSITTEQHRKKMKNGKEEYPLWGDVFKQTHLEKSAKVKLASGELIGSQPEHWVNENFWTVFDKYEKTMCEKYGPNPSQHPLGDVEIWEHCVGGKKKGRVYGVGSEFKG
ncbi:hypothetical protein Lser_V15G06926 [Lactuca serriola]